MTFHLLSIFLFVGAFFMIFFGLEIGRVTEHIILLFFFAPLIAMMFAIPIGLEIWLKNPKYEKQIRIVLSFLFGSWIAGMGVMGTLLSKDIFQIIVGIFMVFLGILFSIGLYLRVQDEKQRPKTEGQR
ncbi:MAG: hypothetical protein AB1779_02450 [Candidatus Thermoplasmatota archaeon]